MLTGCTATQSAFVQAASNAGSAYAAAATTLAWAHRQQITPAYAASSFVNFQSELSGLDRQLPSLQGAPGEHTVRRLLALYRRAEQAVMHPCLEQSCQWRTQVANLHRASRAFLKAAGA